MRRQPRSDDNVAVPSAGIRGDLLNGTTTTPRSGDHHSSIAAIGALDPKRIKACLYKEEPNLAKMKPPALQLVTVTTAVFIKTLVESEAASIGDSSSFTSTKTMNGTRTSEVTGHSRGRLLPSTTLSHQRKRKKEADNLPKLSGTTLVTLDMIKRKIAQTPSFEYLVEPLGHVKDRFQGTPYGLIKSTAKENNVSVSKRLKPSSGLGDVADGSDVQHYLNASVRDMARIMDKDTMTSTNSGKEALSTAAAVSSVVIVGKDTSQVDLPCKYQRNQTSTGQGNILQADEDDYD